MIDDGEPALVTSSKSRSVVADGYRFTIEIHPMGCEQSWTLEIVEVEGTSHVWDDTFPSDRDARDTALLEIKTDEAVAFLHGDNVVAFRRT